MAPPPPPSPLSPRLAHRLLSNRPPTLSPQLSPSSSTSSSTPSETPPPFLLLLPRNLYSFRSPPPPPPPSLLAWNDTRGIFAAPPLKMESVPPPPPTTTEMEWWDEEEGERSGMNDEVVVEMGVSARKENEVVERRYFNPSLGSLMEEVKEKKKTFVPATERGEMERGELRWHPRGRRGRSERIKLTSFSFRFVSFLERSFEGTSSSSSSSTTTSSP